MRGHGSFLNGGNPYEELVATQLPWLGGVPRHWRVQRAKSLLRAIDVRSTTGGEELLTVSSERGVVPRRSVMVTMFKAESYVGYKLCWPGDLVINSLWAWGRGLGVSAHHGIVSSAYGVYRSRSTEVLVPRYLHYLVRSAAFHWELQVRSKGIWISRLQLTDEAFLNAPLPVPPLEEQEAIVRFLDHADRRIRRYIRAKQKLVKLLEEQAQAEINQAIRCGGTRSLSRRPSGVGWLGDIPARWEVRRLKWVIRLQRGYDLPADSRFAGPIPVVSSGGVIDSHSEARARGPGVVLGRYGSTDAVYYIDSDFWPHNTALFVTDFQGNRPKWCYYLLRTISKADHAGKSAVPGVDRKDLYEIEVPVPPLDDQDSLVAHIEITQATLDRALVGTRRDIALMQDLRTRLVADVVTGKLDVREAAAKLPHESGGLAAPDSEELLLGDEASEEPDVDAGLVEAEA